MIIPLNIAPIVLHYNPRPNLLTPTPPPPHSPPSTSFPSNQVLVAGGSGLLGDTIINNLRSAASSNKALVDVTVLSRSPSSATPESTDNFKLKYVMWDGETPQLNNSDVEGLTHAINLCGENISEGGETLLAKLGIRSWEEEVRVVQTLLH